MSIINEIEGGPAPEQEFEGFRTSSRIIGPAALTSSCWSSSLPKPLGI